MRRKFISWGLIYLLAAMASGSVLLFEAAPEYDFNLAMLTRAIIAGLHAILGLWFIFRFFRSSAGRSSEKMAVEISRLLKTRKRKVLYQPDDTFLIDLLFVSTSIVFVFQYVFALAANMDYVQRFIASGGNLHLGENTKAQRLNVIYHYGLFLAVYPAAIWAKFLTCVNGDRKAMLKNIGRMFLVATSVLLTVLSFPGILHPEGLGFFAWFAMVPLFAVLRRSGFHRWMFYGFTWVAMTTVLKNYWLGTFSLVSLQTAFIILVLRGMFFFTILWLAELMIRRIQRLHPERRFLGGMLWVWTYAILWTLFDWSGTQGFTAYPWTLFPHSQYRNLLLMQITPGTGIWGISLLLYAANAAIACVLCWKKQRSMQVLAVVTALVVSVHLLGGAVLLQNGPSTSAIAGTISIEGDTLKSSPELNSVDERLRIALVQQNTDPRKNDYRNTLDRLIDLTDASLANYSYIDLVAWSETAFVPNIRRWGSGEENPNAFYVRLVQEFLDYQRDIDTWLLTGNDDYQVHRDEDGNEISRDSYNAAVLFDPEGNRMDTYHKIHLVPFTESFPFEEQFPAIYQFLQDFDVSFWEPGSEYTVFEHGDFSFSTPICYEDAFPDDVRNFVLAGSDIILNISNDYWSQTNVATRQHFAAALFRAVENRRYFLRSTTSGLTSAVDPWGRIIGSIEPFTEGVLVVDVPSTALGNSRLTMYTQFGDWVIPVLVVIFLLMVVMYIVDEFRELRVRRL